MKNRFIAEAAIGVIAAAVFVVPMVTFADSINRQLDLGMTGSDVSMLQSFLATDVSLYPEGLVTGYYGSLTAAAVARFQTRNDLASVGRVGPLTLPVLNAQMSVGLVGNTSASKAPAIANVTVTRSVHSAIVGWTTDEAAQGIVYYSTSPLTMTENGKAVAVNGLSAMSNTNFNFGQSVSLPNLAANTTYYYLVYTLDQSGNVSITWPSSFVTTN